MSTLNGGPNLIVTDGLVLYLDAGNRASYPGSGTTWRDLSAYKNNGTLINGPTFDSTNGGSIVFDGTDDKAVINSWSWTTSSTISFFVYPISSAGQYHRIIGSENFNYEIGINNLNQMSYFPSTTNSWITGIVTLSLNWNYVSLVQNSTSLIIYINGVSTYNGSKLLQSTDLGTLNISSNYVNNTENANIKMSLIQIYNRALSATEVSQNYNALKSRFGL